jgi:hypothetical protein
MQNLQNIPGETDVDTPMPDDHRPNEEKRNQRGDVPLPSDKIPSAPVEEPKSQPSMNENPREPQRIMSFFTASQRRIF